MKETESNTTEEWEEDFGKTEGLGLYTNEYGYVHRIPNYEAIKQFISKIYNKDIVIDICIDENCSQPDEHKHDRDIVRGRILDLLAQQRKEIVEWSKELIGKHNARILNEFQKQGTAEMPLIAYDERICLIPAITIAMEETDADIITKLSEPEV